MTKSLSLTPAQNSDEVAHLLALGIRRLHSRKTVGNLHFHVDFRSKWSVHATPSRDWRNRMNETVFKKVTALTHMTGKDLITLWKNLFEKDPPSTNRGYLIKRLAYRIQEIAYGVDIHDVEERLNKLAKTKRCIVKTPHKPQAGTTLVRTYEGVEHHVTVLAEGFEYKGARYHSLSQIARHITNTRWNGLVFFGLKRSGVKS